MEHGRRTDTTINVKLFIALAPAAFMGNITTPLKYLVPFRDEISFTVHLLTHGNFLPDNKFIRPIRVILCKLFQELCENILFVAGGRDRAQINQTRFEVIAGHFPVGSSFKSIVHYAQLVASNKYAKYDYEDKNMEHYNQAYPPEFDLSRITTPVAFFWSSNDRLVNPKDVDVLRGKLNSLVFDYQVPYPYEHFDYIFAVNANQLIYEPILRLLPQY